MSRRRDVAPDERGTGLVELLVATGLGVLGLAVLAAVVRGPVAVSIAATAARPDVDGAALLRGTLAGAVRSARADRSGPAVVAAGPDEVLLRIRRRDGVGWWSLVVTDGAVRVRSGSAPIPDTPGASTDGSDGGVLPLAPVVAHLVVRDATGVELAGPEVGSADGPLLASAVVIELHPVDPALRPIAVALRSPP